MRSSSRSISRRCQSTRIRRMIFLALSTRRTFCTSRIRTCRGARFENLSARCFLCRRRRWGPSCSGKCGRKASHDVEELLGVHFGESADEAVTTVAGLLSHVSGKVPAPGDKVDLQGYRFQVLEANQRKVLRLRIKKQKAAPATTT